MKLQIFNVAHGFAALLTGDTGNIALFDCGHDDEGGFRPSTFLRARGHDTVHRLFISHFDTDHVSDLPELRSKLFIHALHRNKSITPQQIRTMKLAEGPLSSGLTHAVALATDYNSPLPNPPVFPGVEFGVFYNSYPAVQDSNNLSLVAFIHYDGVSIVIPGDLEVAGWRLLLQNQTFREHLAKVNIFVASHHGRENGYVPRSSSFASQIS